MSDERLTTTLLRWFHENGRELPWRATRDPYAIWLSEIILQQTRTEQGRPYWERFLRRWPTVQQLAAASEDEVLREWQGLGYYSRARNLHAAARQIAARGSFPNTIEALRSLKGVGDYTAAAVGSIAFGLPAAVVDGNVYRVLSRYFAISTPINTTAGKREFTELAQRLLPPDRASDFNQAMMDFGAIQCVPVNPRCELCPLQDGCLALHENRVMQLPVKQRTLQVKERRLRYVYIRCQGYTAIHRRGAGDIWEGLYEPWLTEQVPPAAMLLCKDVKHVLTHRVIYADFYQLVCNERPQLPDDYFWIRESDVDDYAIPRLIEILLKRIP